MNAAVRKQACMLIVGALMLSGVGMLWAVSDSRASAPIAVVGSDALDGDVTPVAQASSGEISLPQDSTFDPIGKLDPRLRDGAMTAQKGIVKVYIPTYDLPALSRILTGMGYEDAVGPNGQSGSFAMPLVEVSQKDLSSLVAQDCVLAVYQYDAPTPNLMSVGDPTEAPLSEEPAPFVKVDSRFRVDRDEVPAAASAGDGEHPELVDAINTHKAIDAWGKGYEGDGVRVAIVDSGVDFGHPDLEGTQARFDVSEVSNETLAEKPYLANYDGWAMAFDAIGLPNWVEGEGYISGGYVDTSAVSIIQTEEFTVSGEEVTNVSFKILYVDDDDGDWTEDNYTDALDANAYSYDVWDVAAEGSEPTLADMSPYAAIVWGTWYSWSGVLEPETQADLMDYIDNGGMLFFSSIDYSYDKGTLDDFDFTYLGVDDIAQDGGAATIVGVTGDIIGGGIAAFAPVQPYGDYIDNLVPAANVTVCFENDLGDPVGVYQNNTNGPVVFFGFPFEELSPADAATVMGNVIGWFQQHYVIPTGGAFDFGPQLDFDIDPATVTVYNNGVEMAAGDFDLDPVTGEIAYVTPLSVSDVVTADYTYFREFFTYNRTAPVATTNLTVDVPIFQDDTSYAPFEENFLHCQYWQNITVPDGTVLMTIQVSMNHGAGGADDVDVALFYDANGDGVPTLGELVSYAESSTGNDPEVVPAVSNPETEYSYILAILGYTTADPGLVDISITMVALTLDEYEFTVTGIPSESGTVRVGLHPDAYLPSIHYVAPTIMVTDSTDSGVYDTVLTDLDMDNSFVDETRAVKGDEVMTHDIDGDGLADLSGGMLYFIADGVTPVPYSDVYAERYGFNNTIPGDGDLICLFGDFQTSSATTHGTLCASSVVGQGTGYGLVTGMAPNAKILAIGDIYAGSTIDAWYFAVEGYDGDPLNYDGAHVASNSFGYGYAHDGWDYYSRFVDWLTTHYAQGRILFTASAGNEGYGYGSVSGPCSPAVLNVGAATHMFYRTLFGYDGGPNPLGGDMISFSSRGPTAVGYPGVDVAAIGAFAYGDYPLNYAAYGISGLDSWDIWSGTSLSSPTAAGLLALAYDAYFDANGEYPDLYKARELAMAGADDHQYDVFAGGAGYMNADEMTDMASGVGGISVTPDTWYPGDYDGSDAALTAHLVFPGQEVVDEFTLNDWKSTGAPGSASVTAETLERVDYINYTFNPQESVYYDSWMILKEDGLYDWNGNLVKTIPAGLYNNVDLMKISAGFPDGHLSTVSTTFLETHGWTDVNGDDKFVGHSSDVTRFAVSDDGSMLASVGQSFSAPGNSEVIIWDGNTLEVLDIWTLGTDGNVQCLEFTPDNKYLVAVEYGLNFGDDGYTELALVYNLQTHTEMNYFFNPAEYFWPYSWYAGADLSADGSVLALGGIWNWQTNYFYSAGIDEVEVYNPVSGDYITGVQGTEGNMEALALNSDGTKLATAHYRASWALSVVNIFDITTEPATLENSYDLWSLGHVSKLSFSGDDSQILMGMQGGDIWAMDIVPTASAADVPIAESVIHHAAEQLTDNATVNATTFNFADTPVLDNYTVTVNDVLITEVMFVSNENLTATATVAGQDNLTLAHGNVVWDGSFHLYNETGAKLFEQWGPWDATAWNITHTANDATLPVGFVHPGMLYVYLNGSWTALTEGVDYTADYVAGTIHFITPIAPSSNVTVEYYYSNYTVDLATGVVNFGFNLTAGSYINTSYSYTAFELDIETGTLTFLEPLAGGEVVNATYSWYDVVTTANLGYMYIDQVVYAGTTATVVTNFKTGAVTITPRLDAGEVLTATFSYYDYSVISELDWVNDLAVAGDTFVAANDTLVVVYDLVADAVVSTIPADGTSMSAGFFGEGESILVGYYDGSVYAYNATTGVSLGDFNALGGWSERNRMSYDAPATNTFEVRCYDPDSQLADGLLIWLRDYYAAWNPTTWTVTIEFFQKATWDWIEVAPTVDGTFEATLSVPDDASPGLYEGAFYLVQGQYSAVVPIVVNVAATRPVFEFGGDADAPVLLYDNNRMYGATSTTDPDQRYFFFDWQWGPDLFSPGEETKLLVDVNFANLASYADVKHLQMAVLPDDFADPITEYGDTSRYGTFVLEEVDADAPGYFAKAEMAGGFKGLTAKPGLNVIMVRGAVLNGTHPGEFMSGEAGFMNINPYPVSVYTNQLAGTKPVDVFSTIDWMPYPVEFDNTGKLDPNYEKAMTAMVAGSSEEVYEDVEIWSEPYENESPFQAYIVKSQNEVVFELDEGVVTLNVHMVCDSDVPDADLGLFYDANDDGVATLDEFVVYDAAAGADEEVSVLLPAAGRYFAKMAGFTVLGAPGHADVTITTLVVGASAFSAENVPTGIIPGGTLSGFDLGWNLPGDAEDGITPGAFFLSPGNVPLGMTMLVPVELVLDRSAPEFTTFSIEGGAIYNTDTPSFVFEAKDLAEPVSGIDSDNVRVFVDGIDVTKQSAVTINYNEKNELPQNVSVTVRATYEDGTHLLCFEVYDQAGNVNKKYAEFSVDTKNPALVLEGIGGSVIVTNDETYTLSGVAEVGSSVEAGLEGATAPIALADDGTFETIVALEDGMNTVKAVSTDAAGNARIVTASVVLDTTAPVISLGNKKPFVEVPATTMSTVAPITGTLPLTMEDEIYGVTLTVNGMPVTVNHDGTYAIDVYLQANKANVITMRVTDAAGNSDDVASVFTTTVTVDKTAPMLTIDPAEQYLDTLNITGMTESGATIRINGEKVATTSGAVSDSFAWSATLSPGTNVIVVEAVDSVGNVQETRVTVTYDEAHSLNTVTVPKTAPKDTSTLVVVLMIILLIIGLLVGFAVGFIIKKGLGGKGDAEEGETPEETGEMPPEGEAAPVVVEDAPVETGEPPAEQPPQGQ